jgi:hypothetical protein
MIQHHWQCLVRDYVSEEESNENPVFAAFEEGEDFFGVAGLSAGAGFGEDLEGYFVLAHESMYKERLVGDLGGGGRRGKYAIVRPANSPPKRTRAIDSPPLTQNQPKSATMALTFPLSVLNSSFLLVRTW